MLTVLGWKQLFDASWRSFSGRFNSILQRLASNRELADKEAQSYSILEGKEFRQKVLEQIDRSEKERFDFRLRDTLAWLDLQGQDREQQDLFECRSMARKDGTCEWILNNSKVRSWLDPEDGRSLLWLRGKPGSGRIYPSHPEPANAFHHREDNIGHVPNRSRTNTARWNHTLLPLLIWIWKI